MEISEKIDLIIKKLNLSQKELALNLDLSINAISQYVTGKRKPDYNTSEPHLAKLRLN